MKIENELKELKDIIANSPKKVKEKESQLAKAREEFTQIMIKRSVKLAIQNKFKPNAVSIAEAVKNRDLLSKYSAPVLAPVSNAQLLIAKMNELKVTQADLIISKANKTAMKAKLPES